MVQLWADGPYWATTNIGADTPEAYGQYFAWGYPTGQTPSCTTFSTAFNATSYPNITTSPLNTDNDMAAINWGAEWSVPTKTDFDNLLNNANTEIEYIMTGDHTGIKIKGLGSYANNSIFLPAAGFGFGPDLFSAGYCSYYWSSVQHDSIEAYRLYFLLEDEDSNVNSIYKCYGFPVRPVLSN